MLIYKQILKTFHLYLYQTVEVLQVYTLYSLSYKLDILSNSSFGGGVKSVAIHRSWTLEEGGVIDVTKSGYGLDHFDFLYIEVQDVPGNSTGGYVPFLIFKKEFSTNIKLGEYQIIDISTYYDTITLKKILRSSKLCIIHGIYINQII